MIAGDLSNTTLAASYIYDRITAGHTSLRWHVWREADKIHYCSDNSKQIIPDQNYIGTYSRTKLHQPDVSDIRDDILASIS